MKISWKLKYMLQSVYNNSAVKLGVWIVTQHCDRDKCMAPGHIASVPSMASLATVDTSSSVYAPTQRLNWVYLTLADQNSSPATDQVPVSSCSGHVGLNRLIKISPAVDRWRLCMKTPCYERSRGRYFIWQLSFVASRCCSAARSAQRAAVINEPSGNGNRWLSQNYGPISDQ
jgi:hypothetical protein